MSSPLPLSALLSQALVAYTIEFDNEFEQRMPHRITNHDEASGPQRGPWLTSLVMWSNCMRFVSEEGITVARLEQLAGTSTNLHGMQRWRYIVVEPGASGLIRPTRAGRRAQEIWAPLFGEIEERWRTRFEEGAFDRLRKSLEALVQQFDFGLPDCLPILGYGLFSRVKLMPKPAGSPDLTLATLLSKSLLAFAIEFERKSIVSLAIGANVLRMLTKQGVRVRDLPRLSGVSKEAMAMALGYLQKRELIVIGPDPEGSRNKIVALTSAGIDAQTAYRRSLAAIEKRWEARFGLDTIHNLRESIEGIAGKLFLGLEPYPGGWRASVPKPGTLPHYPMVLHRGGYPDGS